MSSSSRIYVVKTKGSEEDITETSLVRAPTKASALRHLAEQCFVASVATQDELVDLVGKGVRVEDAGAEDPES